MLARLGALIVPFVLLAVLTVGCGDTVIDQVKAEDAVESSLESDFHEKIRSVDCPSNQPVDPGTIFSCEVIFSNGERKSAELKIRNKDADISLVGLKANK
ncbi:MAG: DUF4333 domain-containing protein [Thermoleophilia bacterium]|nr:DUF4333 domain-containing protein [Thermoleophilia bacterium]